MRKTLLVMSIIGLTLVGASVAMAQTEEGNEPPFGGVGGGIVEVLDDLVSDGTLTQDQADAVVDALEERRAEFRAEREAVREAMQEAWSDDVLTEDELASLPERAAERIGPDGPLADYWDDGQLTRDELDEAHAGLGAFHRGHHRGGVGPFGADS